MRAGLTDIEIPEVQDAKLRARAPRDLIRVAFGMLSTEERAYSSSRWRVGRPHRRGRRGRPTSVGARAVLEARQDVETGARPPAEFLNGHV